jgi:D-aminopeptidase
MPHLAELVDYPRQILAGAHNAITDVPGVAVGHTTVIEGEGEWQPGRGPFRTGVTLVLPHTGNLYEEKVPAAVYTINGFGKPVGFEQIRELGNIETPIALTGTLNAPRVADALITLAIEENGYIGVGFAESGRQGYASVNPVVGETSDGYLSDLQGRPVGLAEVRAALEQARASGSGTAAEGAIGAGTGTSCYGWKGGIGTASRRLPALPGIAEPFTVGVLVQTNFGRPEELTILGVPIGRHLRPPDGDSPHPAGSVMIVLATDAPLDSRQLARLAHRAPFGLARTGSTCHGGSGDFVIAFSTGPRIPDRPAALLTSQPILYEQPAMNAFSLAVIESVEEAVYNSLLQARTITGRDGHTRYALPAEQVLALLEGKF